MILNRIYKEYGLPLKLYENVKNSLNFQYKNDIDEIIKFTENLPQDLRVDVTYFIFEKTFKQIDYFKNRPYQLIAWICPLLKPMVLN